MAPDDGARRQRAAADTREGLLVAARAVFEERGYQAATVAEITRAARTAHGTFYLYFSNKEHAFVEVVRHATEAIYEQGARRWPAGDPRRGIDAVIRGYLHLFFEHRALWRSVLEASFTTPTIETMFVELRRPLVERLARNLRRQLDAGTLRPLDPDLTATALAAMVEWTAATEFVLQTPGAVPRSVDEVADALVDLWCVALYGDDGAVSGDAEGGASASG